VSSSAESCTVALFETHTNSVVTKPISLRTRNNRGSVRNCTISALGATRLSLWHPRPQKCGSYCSCWSVAIASVALNVSTSTDCGGKKNCGRRFASGSKVISEPLKCCSRPSQPWMRAKFTCILRSIRAPMRFPSCSRFLHRRTTSAGS